MTQKGLPGDILQQTQYKANAVQADCARLNSLCAQQCFAWRAGTYTLTMLSNRYKLLACWVAAKQIK